MAQSKAASIIFVIAVFFSVAISAVSAQDSPAPAPNGAPFSMPISATSMLSLAASPIIKSAVSAVAQPVSAENATPVSRNRSNIRVLATHLPKRSL
ncbi:hypothetical protein Nepgr_029103 [Nepenthes gracilis]|uniref:Uncharacterized protein n=1 Tax=Nepenthes gracilis TaxID=150966 RepID=A0AAD3TBT3_NEPGR|nr:hypothetical protein Nepgr_029103 [Nepenthes gracilis]